MTQTLSPLFGVFSTAAQIARGAGNQPGIVAQPVLVASGSGGTWSVGLGVNPGLGFWAWRTPWTNQSGAYIVTEDATVTFGTGITLPTGTHKRNLLLVARFKWVAGPVGGDGKPLGLYTDGMKPTYEVVAGTDADSPSDPAVSATDGSGRVAVVLARVVLDSTGATIEWIPETMLDLAAMGALIDGKHNREGDERHIGKFKVTEAPLDDEDVVRKADITSGIAAQYANGTYASANNASIYPLAGGIPARFTTKTASGQNVEVLANGFRAKRTGIYKVEFAVKQHGSASPGYLTCDWAVKLASNPSAGFATTVFHDWDFFNNGKSEATVPGTFMVPLAENDVLGCFWTSDNLYLSFINACATITYLGVSAPTDVLSITTADFAATEAAGQTYPTSITRTLAAANAMGAVTWSIDAAGAGQIDGTTDPAATIVAGALQIAWATQPASLPQSWGIKLRAVDASGAIATKTITCTLQAAQPLAISTGTQYFSGYDYDYPLAVSFQCFATGGLSPLTWAIVAGADTTLPDAAINASTGILTGTATTYTTYSVRVRCTDSTSPTPQQVEKVIAIHATQIISEGDPSGGSCFVAGTQVLMADGSAKPIEEVRIGDEVMGVVADAFQSGIPTLGPQEVTDTSYHEGVFPLLATSGAIGTDYHRFAATLAAEGASMWLPARNLGQHPVELVTILDEALASTPVHQEPAGNAVEVWNLTTTGQTFFVRGSEEHPWLLVHNVKAPMI